MSEAIKNRYDFVILFDVENGNPNGDPDAGNMPRVDPETGYGLVTDVCLKRKIRNYVETLKEDEDGYRIYIKDGVPLNRSDKAAITALGISEDLKAAKKSDPEIDRKLRDYMCANYYDIRTFGAVMTTFVKGALNCGQVRGPVQIGFARSIDPIVPQEVTITRVAITTEADAEKKGTEMGRKHIVPYALYRAEGFVSANLASTKAASTPRTAYSSSRGRIAFARSELYTCLNTSTGRNTRNTTLFIFSTSLPFTSPVRRTTKPTSIIAISGKTALRHTSKLLICCFSPGF